MKCGNVLLKHSVEPNQINELSAFIKIYKDVCVCYREEATQESDSNQSNKYK